MKVVGFQNQVIITSNGDWMILVLPGKVIISDHLFSTEYPATLVIKLALLNLVTFWFDNDNVCLVESGIKLMVLAQWVSISKTGPQGPIGPTGSYQTIVVMTLPTYGRT